MFVDNGFRYSSWRVGQTVVLRDGTKRTITELWPQKSYYPVRCDGDGWTDIGTWTRVGGSQYSGESYTMTEHANDIVRIEGNDGCGGTCGGCQK